MGKSKKARASKKKGGGAISIAIVAILILGVGAIGYKFMSASSTISHRVPGGENRPTLDPALFSGSVARAYQVAREIPQVLDQLYCHCKCIENSGHLSNLSCFVDRHGAG